MRLSQLPMGRPVMVTEKEKAWCHMALEAREGPVRELELWQSGGYLAGCLADQVGLGEVSRVSRTGRCVIASQPCQPVGSQVPRAVPSTWTK